MVIVQKEIYLPGFKRGFHLITNYVTRELDKLPESGLLHVHIMHTSAALTLNENADPSVRTDFNTYFDKLVKDGEHYYTHTLEGDDDMPAHIKSSLLGASVTIPIKGGRLNLGTWQGIYLCEFRNSGGSRRLFITVLG